LGFAHHCQNSGSFKQVIKHAKYKKINGSVKTVNLLGMLELKTLLVL